MRDYEIISTDSHLEVSPDRWRPYVDAGVPGVRADQVVKLPNGGDAWLMPGKSQPVPLGLNFSAGRGWEKLKTSGLSYADGWSAQVTPSSVSRRWTRTASTPRCCSRRCRANARSTSPPSPARPTSRSRAATTTGCRRSTPPRIPTGCSASPSCPCATIDDSIAELERVARCRACAASCCTSGRTARRIPEARGGRPVLGARDRARRAAHRARELRWRRRRRGAGACRGRGAGRAADQLRADDDDAVEDRDTRAGSSSSSSSTARSTASRICSCSSPRPRSAGSPSSRRTPTRTGGATATGAAPTSGHTSRAGTSTTTSTGASRSTASV